MTLARKAALIGLALPIALSLSLGLGGCISVFPKTKPVQMYGFGSAPPAPTRPVSGVMISKGSTVFPQASASDRILTVTGAEEAYIADARWVAPAATLFDQAILKAFDAQGSARLVERGEPLSAPFTLRLDVREFDVRYPGPVATVTVRASLTRNADRTVVAETVFQEQVPASDNRQTAIVAAFDQAVDKAVGDIRDFASSSAAAAPRPR
jgi:cholesterol transport system auxiliary component